MKIGRKIYYELATGNIILNTGERQDNVVKTTIEQDFQFYIALQPYQQSVVGVVQCDYGYEISNFMKYPYHIDITKNPIDETAIVWDTTNPFGTSLSQVQQAKTSQIIDFYNQKLIAGFSSSATGTAHIFGYGQTDQMKFMQLAILVISNMAVFPIDIPAKDNILVSHTQAQYNQLLVDIATFAQTQNTKEHDYINQVQARATVEEVNAIVVSF